ncbi:hypothetical protein WJX75_003222 [Coccomyxa subellipsoidea]|uniref:RecQ mediated genome instability protein 1 OB-fold domain-containing protein n=1 Tax=Coccomyxa subellipsoidea TaxID=248742 RepID=A0ABR2YCU3_9CHLO
MNGLINAGWSLKEDVWKELEYGSSEDLLQQSLLDIDLRKAGKAALPNDIPRSDARLVKGPHVVQVMACDNVAHPSRGVSGSSKGRMLRLKLTDGKTTCKAVEMRPLPDVTTEELPPGTKVCISNASVKAGLLLLDSKSIKVLGGHVEELYEAWEFQRKYGAGAARPAAEAGSSADLEQPPPFQTFVPGKTRAPRRPAAAADAADAHAAHTAPAAATVQHDAIAAAGRPLGIAPPPGFHSMPDKSRSGNAAAADVSRPAPEAFPAGPGVVHYPPGRPAAAGNLPGRAGPSAAAKAKLQERLAASEEGARGRGGQRGRGRRRGRFQEEEESGMTLDEWEAQQRSKAAGVQSLQPSGGQGQMLSDEELARQLQRQLDMEDSLQQEYSSQPQPRSAANDLKASLFAYERPAENTGYRGRGRRGRGRGRY